MLCPLCTARKIGCVLDVFKIIKVLKKKDPDHRFAEAVDLNFPKQRTCHTIGNGWYSFSIKPNVP